MTTVSLEGISVVLLDIEGTTTPISFVYGTLFPYARAHMREFLSRRGGEPDVAGAMAMLEGEPEALMDRDSKSPALKVLQGMIWEEGYASGELRGVVFHDVPDAVRLWRAAGLRTCIYSSGSLLAQKLIVGTTPFGDLTPLFDGFFDTEVGSKREPASYREIARRLGCAPGAILFISDVMPELTAAAAAGCRAVLIVRPGNLEQHGVGTTPVINSLFDLDT